LESRHSLSNGKNVVDTIILTAYSEGCGCGGGGGGGGGGQAKDASVHATQAYKDSGGTAPVNLHLVIKWRWMLTFTPGCFTPGEKNTMLSTE
jgi:hypothetical protein